jgi:uncharacterized protein (TIGR03437 family)
MEIRSSPAAVSMLVGGPDDNTQLPGIPATAAGAAWVFTRSGGVWTQQGNKLVGAGGAALVSGSAGQYEIAIQIPSTLANGGWPVQATIGGVSSSSGAVLTVHQ